LSDYWVVAGAPQILANANGEIQITDDIAGLIDTDSDGSANDVDTDHDKDGIPNANDLFPYSASEFSDVDLDGFSDSVANFQNIGQSIIVIISITIIIKTITISIN